MSKTALSLAARRSADSHPRCAGSLLSALRRPYSNKNRMKSVSWVVSSVTQTQSYSINALGQRLKKTKTAGTAPQATVHFTYDEAGRLTGEYNANNQLVQEVLWLDDMPLATLRPRAGQTLQTIGATGQLSGSTVQVIDAFHIHADHLNTPRVITRPSDNKKVWEWVNSEPFGNNAPNENPQAVGTFTFNLAFPGQYRDKETGLNYNYVRDYNPQTGRYQQSDPIGLYPNPVGEIENISTYTYVGANPLLRDDPKGLIWGGAGRAGFAAFALCMRIKGCRDAIEKAWQKCKDIECRFERHGAHHPFPNLGWCEHYSLVCWIKGQKGGGPIFKAQWPFPGRCSPTKPPGPLP